MYFNEKGKANTEKCVELAIKEARNRHIKHIVVATNSGYTGKLFKEAKDLNIVCVTHSYGSKKPGENIILGETVEKLKSLGIKVLTTTHVLSGAERGISKKFGGVSPVEIMAHTLRMFGQGTKVCVEVSVMALDAGFIPYGEEIIAVGGSAEGADTAVVISPAHANNILDTKINEIICKPKNF
ncbi:pyruvate kinase alpha/beta domain-containing protein [Haloimpatiens massiliensis]|uniref:pyruvate kinase alpha/beta domain-containing protein n=1 Tax=Haloimpatiens massiliensis TaxID=1658110 RepID=UPI000C853F9C|nr:pyruvate kinase alpha/beta domain-containing protein [Haloimpatiens massiliensis]